jgi:hypothetical protein
MSNDLLALKPESLLSERRRGNMNKGRGREDSYNSPTRLSFADAVLALQNRSRDV